MGMIAGRDAPAVPLFYEAWRELDEMEEFLGLEVVRWQNRCSAVDGDFSSCPKRKPCDYCSMTRKYGQPPGKPFFSRRPVRRWR